MTAGWRPSSGAIAPPSTPPAGRRVCMLCGVARTRLLIVAVALVLGVPVGFIFAHAVRVPQVKTLEDYQPAIITRIYDRSGVGFAEYAIQRRIVVSKRDMSPW